MAELRRGMSNGEWCGKGPKAGRRVGESRGWLVGPCPRSALRNPATRSLRRSQLREPGVEAAGAGGGQYGVGGGLPGTGRR